MEIKCNNDLRFHEMQVTKFTAQQYCLATNYGHVCVGKLIPVLQ